MIVRHPEVRDHFLILDRHETFGDYARAYWDALSSHYELPGIIVVPHMPISFDVEYFQSIGFPREWKKIGTGNGIERPIVARERGGFAISRENPFVGHFTDLNEAIYAQSQIASFDAQLRRGLVALFPFYHSLRELNITWRLCETVDEAMHIDVFAKGRPLAPAEKSVLRVKIFVNIDREPRRWRVSHDLATVLRECRGTLPPELPDDLNVTSDIVNKLAVLKDLPAHEVAYPSMSALIVNSELIAHQVDYGRRLIAGEFFCDRADMLDPGKSAHTRLRSWLADAGYRIAKDPAAVAREYAATNSAY